MARLLPGRRLRRTARLAGILDIVALRKAAEAVTAALRRQAVAGRTAAAVAADLMAETTADSHF